MKFKSIVLISTIIITLSGCTQLPPDTYVSLGQFTAISSVNVTNLEYKKTLSINHSEGEACYQVDLQDLTYISGPKDNLVQRAMDKAIRNGRYRGIYGDVLINARVERKTKYKEKGMIFKTKERYECVCIEGELVKLVNVHQPRLVQFSPMDD